MQNLNIKHIIVGRICLLLLLTAPSLSAYASSDSAKVICSAPHAGFNKASMKQNVIALLSMDEVLPECTQHVVNTKVLNAALSESGVSIQSMRFKWQETDTTVMTNIGENVILTTDDIRTANNFIQVGKDYLIHFQLCAGTPPSLINMYALNTTAKSVRKSKIKPANPVN